MTDCCCRQPRFAPRGTTLLLLSKATGEILWRRALRVPPETESGGVAVIGTKLFANRTGVANTDGGNNARYEIWDVADPPFINLDLLKINPTGVSIPGFPLLTPNAHFAFGVLNSDDTKYFAINRTGTTHLWRTTPSNNFLDVAGPFGGRPSDLITRESGGIERVMWADDSTLSYRDVTPGTTPTQGSVTTLASRGRGYGDTGFALTTGSPPRFKSWRYDGTALADVAMPAYTVGPNTYTPQADRLYAASVDGVFTGSTTSGSTSAGSTILRDHDGNVLNQWVIQWSNCCAGPGFFFGRSSTQQLSVLDLATAGITALVNLPATANHLAYWPIDGIVYAIEGSTINSDTWATAVAYDGTVLWRTAIGNHARYISVTDIGIFVATAAITI